MGNRANAVVALSEDLRDKTKALQKLQREYDALKREHDRLELLMVHVCHALDLPPDPTWEFRDLRSIIEARLNKR